MAALFIVVAETGVGGNLQYNTRFVFDGDTAEATALAVSSRLNKAARFTYSLSRMPEDRQGSDHQLWLNAARAALHGLDPGAEDDVKYVVRQVLTFAPAAEGPPATAYEAMIRQIRDASSIQ